MESDDLGKVHCTYLQNKAQGEHIVFSNSKITLTIDESVSNTELNYILGLMKTKAELVLREDK